MSVLSDRTIRALSDKPVRSLADILADVRADEALVARLKGECNNLHHAGLQLDLKIDRVASERYNAQDFGMIFPFAPQLIRTVDYYEGDVEVPMGQMLGRISGPLRTRKIISMGTTSYGYDVSLTDDVKIFTNTNALEIDPKRFDQEKCLVDAEIFTDADGARFVRIPPHSYMLGSTREYFRIPRDVMVVCVGKSTYARSGVIVNTTPIEPEFKGNVVIEIANTTPLPARIYLGEGIAQFMFFRGDQPCETSYGDRGGKYQFQRGVTLPTV